MTKDDIAPVCVGVGAVHAFVVSKHVAWPIFLIHPPRLRMNVSTVIGENFHTEWSRSSCALEAIAKAIHAYARLPCLMIYLPSLPLPINLSFTQILSGMQRSNIRGANSRNRLFEKRVSFCRGMMHLVHRGPCRWIGGRSTPVSTVGRSGVPA